MIELRKYQQDSIQDLRKYISEGLRRLMLVAPTGSGKTVMFSYMVKNAVDRGKRCMIVTNRIELISQAGGTLDKYGLKPIEINPGFKSKKLNGVLYTAMAQTLKRRLGKPEYVEFLNNLDLLIFDEAHLQDFNLIQQHVNLEKTVVIGATATPLREKNQVSLHEFYQSITEVVKISELVDSGFLAIPRTFGVKVDLSGIRTVRGDYDDGQLAARYSETKLFHGVFENYQRLTPGKKALIFAANIASSKELVADFKKEGLPVEHIDANTPSPERKGILKWFKETPGAMLSNVGILNAGFDEPSVEVVILYRATKSLPLFLQMCGRGSRVIPGIKSEFSILDFGNNIREHGFWEQDRVWTLVKKKKRDGIPPVKDCPDCGAMLPASAKDCEYCGHHFEPTQKEKAEAVIAELQQMTYQQIQDEIKTADFAKLEMIAVAKGYKHGWIFHQLKTEKDLRDFAKYKNYHHKWVEHQLNERVRKQNTE